ncbi:MAG: hypothetical protein K2Y21_09595 [Phycisphaerales bacterium]|nr:hypothetical protein [Phycisphaerales bacterium]
MTMRICSVLLSVCGATAAMAAPLTPGNLVVMKVGSLGTASGEVSFEEYTKAGVFTGNAIAAPFSGSDAISIPTISNRDRHLHRSVDGRLITFTAYNEAPSANDPSVGPAATIPRTVGILDFHGGLDLSTRFTASYDATSIRSAVTVNGSGLWVAGDNAGGGTVTGGTVYTTRGSSTANNLSQVQVNGGVKTPDNIRDLAIFGGDLYVCSGSNASIGRGVFRMTAGGLPTTGSQMLAAITPDGPGTTQFQLLDLNSSEPGFDVMYLVATNPADSIRRYVKTGGVWAFRGVIASTALTDHILAEANASGGVDIYIATPSKVAKFTDPSPLTGNAAQFAALSPLTIITPAAGTTLGGIAFSTQFCIGDLNNDGFVDDSDFVLFASAYNLLVCSDPAMPYPCPADFNSDGGVDDTDFVAFASAYNDLICP